MAEIMDKSQATKIEDAKKAYEQWKSIKEGMEGYKEDIKEIIKSAAGALEAKPATVSRIFGKMYKDKKAELYEDVAILEMLLK